MQEQFQKFMERFYAEKKAAQEEERDIVRIETLEASKKRGHSSGQSVPTKKPRATKAKAPASAKTKAPAAAKAKAVQNKSPAAAKEAEAVSVSTHEKQKYLLLSHLRG